ncbi:MAG: FimV/HubP family polar landmark protein [Gammaproteobacteria bacterium]
MMRKIVTIFLLTAIPGLVAALGLGKIELNSGLNQPFDARIELLSPTADEIQSLKVGLADSDAFRRAGIDRPFLLSKLKFEIEVTDSGADYIHVTSDDPVREPFLNFLLEANWSSGRLFREYTVLLDPPMYDPNAGRMAPQQPAADTGRATESAEPQPVREEPRRAEPAATTPSAAPRDYSGGDYGPTVSNDTLWSIASAVRPDDVSIQQMMLALLRANPEAFIDNNVNGLRRGHVLRMPDESEINRLNRNEAMAEVRSQYAMWDEARGIMADRATERPVGTPDTGAGTETTTTGTDESELRLRTPEGGTGAGQTDVAGAELRNELAMANEQLESLSSENRELQDRLSEAETIIEDLQRLIALKDDELATLQQQLAAGEEQAETAAPEEDMTAETEADMEDEAMPEEGAAAEPAPEMEEEPVPAPAGIIETARRAVMDNLMILAAAVGLVVLAILALVMIRRRSAEKPESDEASALAGGYPDFDESADSEAATEVPAGSEDETDFGVVDTADAGEDMDLDATAEETVIATAGEEEAAETEAPAAEKPEPDDEEEEEDPLAEVNVFLAYEHFEQAEEFVRDAINEQPDNLDYHSKLLEVFYASGDKAKYEEEARVLHDLVNGEGEYWDMALAMWQEMSPNRALFEEPAEGEEDSRADTTGGGIVDLTSDVSGGDSDAGLDFDLGMEEESAEEPSSSAEDDEEVLDITAGEKEDDSLGQTVSESGGDEDILDVTAAVGLDTDDDEESAGDEDDYFDIGGEESTAGKEDDLLDVSAGGSGEDLLDVTASSDMENDEVEEDLLDVTSATSAGADSDELLGLDTESESAGGSEQSTDDDNTLDFDIGGMEPNTAEGSGEQAEETKDEDDNSFDFDMDMGDSDSGGDEEDKSIGESGSGSGNVIDFDSVSGGDEEDSGLDLESGDTGAAGGEPDLSLDDDNDQEFSLSLDDDDDQGGGLSLDMEEGDDTSASGGEQGDDQGLDLDFTLDGEEKDEQTVGGDEDTGLSLDISSEEDESSSGEIPEIDMESTVEIPKQNGDKEDTIEMTSLEMDEDDEDDEDSTVFVPRSSDTDAQSGDDEIATRLDLAKAYVELGDKDSAKPILEDVIAEGNDDQRRQAQEMMDQLS